jgi:hypothetical protein
MDYIVALEISTPLVVALFAVWLGYVYQQRVSDRDLRRQSYVVAVGLLGEYSELVEVLERLSFAAVSYIRFLAKSVVSPSVGDEDKLKKLRVELDTAVSLTGASPEWDTVGDSDSPAGKEPVNLRLPEAWSALLRRQNELRVQFNRQVLLAISSTRIGVFHHPYSAIEAINRLEAAFSLIDREFYRPNTPSSPHRVDWSPIDRAVSAAWNLALKDIRIIDHMSFHITHQRERIPWEDLGVN